MRTSFTQPAAIRRARHQQPAVRATLTLLRPAVGAARAAVAVEAPGAVEEASKTQAAGRGKGDAAAAGAKPKYQWIDASEHDFTPRYEWDGEELPWLGNTFDGLTLKSAPHEWFQKMDAPEEEYHERAANSEKYRAHRFLHDLDGPGKRCYDGAGEMQYADMRGMDAFLLLGGLDPAVSRDKIFASNRLAVVGHRGADLFTKERMQFVRKFFHPSDPTKATPKGQAGHDNLHQVAPMLKSLSQTCRTTINSGRRKSLDEQTLSFQGASAGLKQNCGKFKAAGDGLQGDSVCLQGGSLKSFAFRGHTLLPKVSIKGKSSIKISDLHSRTLWVLYLADVEAGSLLCMDNLYNSVDFSHMLEVGDTILFDVPKGWTADVDFTGDESAKQIEWEVSDVHVIGTLRGNRGSEKKYQWGEKMGKAATEALRAKPLVPDRVKVRVTADKAQIMTVAIFDKKGFQMIDSYHEEVVETTKPRLGFDKAAGKPAYKDMEITNTQNEYNLGMGFVDLDDLLAWFYK